MTEESARGSDGEDRASFLETFEAVSGLKPSYPVLVFDGKYFSYRMIDQMSSSLSEFLISNGCRNGTKIGISLPMSPQFLISLLGSLKAGCIPVNIGTLTGSEYGVLSGSLDIEWIILRAGSGIEPGKNVKVITARIGDLLPFSRAALNEGKDNIRPQGFVSSLIEIVLEKPHSALHPGRSGGEMIYFLSFDSEGNAVFNGFSGNEISRRADAVRNGILVPGTGFRNASCLQPSSPEGFIFSVALPVLSSGYCIFPMNADPGKRIFRLADQFDANFITVFPEILARSMDIEYTNRDRVKGIITSFTGFPETFAKAFTAKTGFRLFQYFGPPELMGISHMNMTSSGSSGPLKPVIPGETEIMDESGRVIKDGQDEGLLMVRKDPEVQDSPFIDVGFRVRYGNDKSIQFISMDRDLGILQGRISSRKFIQESIGKLPGVAEFVIDFNRMEDGMIKPVIFCVKEGEKRTDERKIRSFIEGRVSSHNFPQAFNWRSNIPRSLSGKVLRNLLNDSS